MSEEKFKVQMEKVFQGYLAKMPKSEETFASAIARVTWLKESVEKVNLEMSPLITEHAADDEDLRKRFKELVVLRTKAMTAEFSK